MRKHDNPLRGLVTNGIPSNHQVADSGPLHPLEYGTTAGGVCILSMQIRFTAGAWCGSYTTPKTPGALHDHPTNRAPTSGATTLTASIPSGWRRTAGSLNLGPLPLSSLLPEQLGGSSISHQPPTTILQSGPIT
jgi:hypothetical protein